MLKWVCSQLGSREKYAIPRALAREGRLEALYTDVWSRPGSLFGMMDDRVKGRYHADLEKAKVFHFNTPFVYFKLRQKLRGDRHVSVDQRYDALVSSSLVKRPVAGEVNFFGYSYASRLSMKAARSLGYRTILGQINPGPAEAELVVAEFKKYKGGKFRPTVPDEDYWDRWREEILYADKILVNSEWSAKLLVQAGVPMEKCRIVPLAYETPEVWSGRSFRRNFTKEHPLRVLYLGAIGIRKGFHLLTEAMNLLMNAPVHLDVVGRLNGPEELLTDMGANVTWHGHAMPADVSDFYKRADVFIFPTLSDGFGLTQLEAQAYRLPVISSRFCAPVITHNRNGIVLEEVTATAIQEVILELIANPDLLPMFSSQAVGMEEYSIERLGGRLKEDRF